MPRFVLEIGVEEIPARFLAGAEAALVSFYTAALAEAGIGHGEIRAWSTPNRLAVAIENLPEKEPERREIITGPPAAIAWNKNGEPGPALLGFVKSNGITSSKVFRQKTEKGEYVAFRKTSGGRPVADVLADLAPAAIASIPFGKKMRWGAHDATFARPLRWLLALFGEEVVPFKFGPLESGRKTSGHRVHGPGPFEVGRAEDYEKIIAENCAVCLDGARRAEIIRQEGDRLAKEVGGEVLWDDKLLEEVSGLVEHPVPMLGAFDQSFLEAPEEALLTSMQTHQKSFGIRSKYGQLLPYFLTVLNIDPVDRDLVKKGWERVLRARLEDARFFWRSDLKQNFDAWLQKLEQVIYIGPLGSMADKSRRLEALCEWLAWQLAPDALDAREAARAGKLAKADLVSAMVGEFDTLQGIMGGIYARRAGESAIVADAISEQYLPAGPDTPAPATVAGCILSMADKADALTGCFGLNMIPTGAADPNGLRRCALGIIRILLERDWHFDAARLFRKCRELYGEKKWKLTPEEADSRLLEFFRSRLKNYFLSLGYNTQMVDAVLAVDGANPADARARLDALAAFSKSGSFLNSSQTLKRIENITRKSGVKEMSWDEELLPEPAEQALAARLKEILPKLDALLASGAYPEALAILDNLREPVNSFFDNVLVMSENEKLRENRLRLLNAIGSRYSKIAAFSLLQL
ncbi:MAG: glycine--tRNA ligase subunit beta [Desulfovibrio sp.]|nr:glycine--tRNA ligase subunit beta [Desulfovibrio sp.]